MTDKGKQKAGSVRTTEKDKGSEVSGGPVTRHNHTTYNSDGSRHETQSVVTSGSSRRMSADVDKDGNVSEVHDHSN